MKLRVLPVLALLVVQLLSLAPAGAHLQSSTTEVTYPAGLGTDTEAGGYHGDDADVSSIQAESDVTSSSFVTVSGNQFMKDGSSFHFAGANSYFLMHEDPSLVNQVIADAVTMNLSVIRVWGFMDRGALWGDPPDVDDQIAGKGVYFQYWDPDSDEPAYNDGQDGLEHLDYLIREAHENGLKVIIVLTNNWQDYGGMDQYLTWYDLDYHDEFYGDSNGTLHPDVEEAYQNWIHHLVMRPNPLMSNTLYRDEPTIMAWELANEPRCNGNYFLPRSCDPQAITQWVSRMSAYLQTIDPNHLVAVGDDGFFNWADAAEYDPEHSWLYNGSEGVDFEAFISLDTVDFGTFHMYPDDWGVYSEPDDWAKAASWGSRWIYEHISRAEELGKPVLLEEFGYGGKDNPANREHRYCVYQHWTDAVSVHGGSGFLFWMLGTGEVCGETGAYSEDGFCIYWDPNDSITTMLQDAASRIGERAQTGSMDVVLIIDSSGSMLSEDPDNLRLDAAKVFIDAMADSDQIAVVDFDDGASVVFELQSVGGNRQDAKDAVEGIDSVGGTNIGLGLQVAFAELESSTSDNLKVAVLMTDGVGGYTNEADAYAEKGWRIYTVGLGDAPDELLLQGIADQTCGQYYGLSNPGQLVQVYFNILGTVSQAPSLLEKIITLLFGDTVSFSVHIPSPGPVLVNFLDSWLGSTVDMTLVDPGGRVITPSVASSDPGITHSKGATYELYQVMFPTPGDWEIKLYGADIPEGGEEVSVQVSVRGRKSMVNLPLAMRSYALPTDPFEPNDTIGEAWGPIEPWETYYGYFLTEDDEDDFYYSDWEYGPGSFPVEVRLTDIPPGNDYALHLYDAAGTLVASSDNADNADEYILYYTLSDLAFIQVERIEGTSLNQPYALWHQWIDPVHP